MISAGLHSKLASQLPDIPAGIVEAYATRISPDYLRTHNLDDIAAHVRFLYSLGDLPLRLRLTERSPGVFEIIIAARDYFSELAIITGLLAAHRLNIKAGYLSGTGSHILDIFLVNAPHADVFSQVEQDQFKTELSQLLELLADNCYQEARAIVNRRLTEVMSVTAVVRLPMQTTEVHFENRPGSPWTTMTISASDTPAFLYTFANALAMRGIAVHSGVLSSTEHDVRDRLEVTDRYGRKLTDPRSQAALRIATVLIQQFTRCLSLAPDPAKALGHFDQMLDQLLEQHPEGKLPTFLAERATLELLARVFGTSDFLWEDFLRVHFETLLPVLKETAYLPRIVSRRTLVRELRRALTAAPTVAERTAVLNRFKDRELFRIDMAHFTQAPQQLEPFASALTELAEVILNETLRLCQDDLARSVGYPRLMDGRRCRFVICGLGKFGGRELGYASDIELLFAYEGGGQTDGPTILQNHEYFERLCQAVLKNVEAKQEGIFHLDVRLRPHGSQGLLANSVEELPAYYHETGLAAPFERQALIKLRWVAGDSSLGQRIETLRDHFVYTATPWDMADALTLRQRQTEELVPSGVVNVKYSPGGLIDIEYAVQYLQIMHGARNKSIRNPSTLMALDALRRARKVSVRDAATLADNYRFSRRLIDALRIVRGNARDLVLPKVDSEEFVFLARRMGYGARRWRAAAEHLQRDINRHMAETQKFFSSRFKSRYVQESPR